MSIKTFILVRNHTNATSVDTQLQLAVICQNTKKKNIQIFKNLTFSNNCIFQNLTLFNKKDISLLSKQRVLIRNVSDFEITDKCRFLQKFCKRRYFRIRCLSQILIVPVRLRKKEVPEWIQIRMCRKCQI